MIHSQKQINLSSIQMKSMAKGCDKTCAEYRDILDTAGRKHKENRQYFKKLKEQKSGLVDPLMRRFHDEVFQKIDCLQCSNCCRGTGPLIRERDITRLSKSLKIKPGVIRPEHMTRIVLKLVGYCNRETPARSAPA